MPKIETKGLNPHDQILVRSAMLFPGADEAQLRRQFYAADLANGTIYQSGIESLRWPIDQLRALLEAPSWTELKLQLEIRTKRATVAAEEALAEMKNPEAVSFGRQANIANGPQQVNNGPTNRPTGARAENSQAPIKQLEQQHGEWLDTGTSGTRS